MNEFWIWFNLGVKHILDLDGYDHILFVTLLVATFPVNLWKNLLVLVTAFTVGHCISLALSVTGNIHADQPVIELLIALSILVTALYHAGSYKKTGDKHMVTIYCIVLFFGFVHGMGFSYLLRAMLGREESVFLPLLYFNLGIEAGQLIIVAIVVLFSLLLTLVFKLPFTIYKLILVCTIGLVALKISVERLLDLFQS